MKSLIVTALPYSADPEPPADGSRHFHVSLFLTHRLSAGLLGGFPEVAEWPQTLREASISLVGSAGPIAVTPLLDDLDDEIWRAVFPGDLPVENWQTPDFTAVPWRSFPAHRMQTYALATHALSMAASPVNAPTPDESVFTPAIFKLLKEHKIYAGRQSGNQLLLALLEPEVRFDARFTEVLRSLIDSKDAASDPLLGVLTDLELARQFYERDVEQREYRDKPLDGATTPRPDQPVFDFHKRASALADLPPLMRALGLIVDLRVEDPGGLSAHQWIRGVVDTPGFTPKVGVQPRVRCQTHGTRFTAVSSSEDYVHGALRVGDPDRFRLLSLDPDASALKLERFLRIIPRLKGLADNKEPVTAAPSTLRSTGFTLTRIGRSDQVRARQERVPALDADIRNGASPLLDAEQLIRGLRVEVWDDVSNTWHSLHKRLLSIAIDGLGTVLDGVANEGSLQGAALTKSDVPGVDTSGQPYYLHETVAGWDGWSLAASRPGLNLVHDTDGSEAPTDASEIGNQPVHASSVVAPGTLPRLRYGRSYRMRAWSVDLAGNSPRHDTHPLVAGPLPKPGRLRATAKRLLVRLGDDKMKTIVAEPPTTMSEPEGMAELRRALPGIQAELSKVVGATGPVVSTRLHAVEAAFAGVKPSQMLADDALVPVDDTVTEVVPFLRWEPVLEPTVVPRFPYTEGESLTTVVVRSGVSDTGAISDPATYVAATTSAFPALGLHWRADSQRHLLPPKTSQLECELHGLFDFAIGTADPSAHRKALAIALKESGSLFDQNVIDVSVPGGTVAQQGLDLQKSPSVDPATAVELPDLLNPENRNKLQAGQYVTIDADEMVVPYLPDPLAGGLSMRFTDAGHDHLFPASVFLEGMQTDYLGEWPLPRPYRLVLTDGDELSARIEDAVITVSLPPGRRLRLTLSSSVPPDMLERLGLWHNLNADLKDNKVVAQVAADGWFWWLTPGHQVQFVHAVPRPVAAPRITMLAGVRAPDQTSATLFGGVRIDGPSTERIDVEGEWTEYTDDPTAGGPQEVLTKGTVGGSAVAYHEEIAVLAHTTLELPRQRFGVHKTVHEFGDTKHRRVHYRVRGTTRYREYFPAQVLPSIDDMSLLSEPLELSIASTARPAPPVVRDVLPLFRWEEETEPEQPFGVRRTRRSGLRVLLERPWYSSGEGELLAVLLSTKPALGEKVSHWGADPVFQQTGPRFERVLPLMDLLHLAGVDDHRDAASPAIPPAMVKLHPADGSATVAAVGYKPVWDEERSCWVVDIGLDPGLAYWPFVQLTLARYQPGSLAGLELSKVVRCDPVQIAPLRFTTVTRPNDRTARIAVTGPVGIPQMQSTHNVRGRSPWQVLSEMHNVRARLERYDASIGSDLGWQTVASVDLQLLFTPGSARVTWAGDLTLPEDLAPARPDGGTGWRVSVEEWEKLMTDSEPGKPRTHARMVYAEQMEL